MDCERGPIAIVYDATTYKGTPVLVCFIAGKNADQWLDKSETELKAGILVNLNNIFYHTIIAKLALPIKLLRK